MTSITDIEQVTPIDIVDDAELLAILGLPTPTSPLSDLGILDWDDMPELSEEEDDTHSFHDYHANNKRRHDDEELFAELDFVEVPILTQSPPNKKSKQVIEDDLSLDLSLLNNNNYAELILNEEDIRLALDYLTSTPSTPS